MHHRNSSMFYCTQDDKRPTCTLPDDQMCDTREGLQEVWVRRARSNIQQLQASDLHMQNTQHRIKLHSNNMDLMGLCQAHCNSWQTQVHFVLIITCCRLPLPRLSLGSAHSSSSLSWLQRCRLCVFARLMGMVMANLQQQYNSQQGYVCDDLTLYTTGLQ